MRYRWLLALILLPLTGCLLIPDDTEKGSRIQNIRPVVQITAGAATADSSGVDYKVLFAWRGADTDGMVLRFQYAVDDTTTESAWTDTTAFGALLKFKASHLAAGSTETFDDWHTFYLRAIDNEYALSKVDKRYFNARTIAPSTKITFPRLGTRPANLVKTFNVEWKGEDIDSSAPEKTPMFYEYKMIRLDSGYLTDEAVVDSLLKRPNTMLDTLRAGDRTRWIRVDGKTTERLLRDLPVTQGSEVFVFCIRAVDEAGAIEPGLEYGENWLMFHIQDQASQPKVTIYERSLGAHEFPSDGPVWEIEVPSDTPIRLRWIGDASGYGSKPGNVNYGLDVPDPQDDRYRDPRGIGGWIGWGKYTGLVSALQFPVTEAGQQHVLYVRMRDAGDLRSSEQLCTVLMTVVAFTFSRPALLVDDARIGYGLNSLQQDPIHDAFIDRFIGHIRDFTGGVLDTRSLYRPQGQNPEALNPVEQNAIKLSELSQYASVLWSFNFTSGEASGIWFHEHQSDSGGARRDKTLLSTYLAAGGKLFLFGGRPALRHHQPGERRSGRGLPEDSAAGRRIAPELLGRVVHLEVPACAQPGRWNRRLQLLEPAPQRPPDLAGRIGALHLDQSGLSRSLHRSGEAQYGKAGRLPAPQAADRWNSGLRRDPLQPDLLAVVPRGGARHAVYIRDATAGPVALRATGAMPSSPSATNPRERTR